MRPASVPDYRAAAKARLPRFLFDYIDGGSYAESTLARNVDDLADVALDQRVLVDVSRIDTATTLLLNRLYDDLWLAQARERAGILARGRFSRDRLADELREILTRVASLRNA